MVHEIVFDESALDELKSLKAFLKTKISDAVERQLVHEPEKPSRNRKCVACEKAGFKFNPPLWELRVGDY